MGGNVSTDKRHVYHGETQAGGLPWGKNEILRTVGVFISLIIRGGAKR